MKILSKILLVSNLCIVISCTNNTDQSESVNTVDIEKNINNMQVVNLSKIAYDIKYIKLKDANDLQLSSISSFDFSSSYILVSDRRNCLLYDFEGNLLLKIGNRGNGPSEYRSASKIALDLNTTHEILIQSIFDLVEYNSDGSFEKKHSGLLTYNKEKLLEEWYPLDDSLIFANIPNDTGMEPNKALMMNFKGKIITFFKNYETFNSDRPGSSLITDFAHIYKFNGSLWFKQYFNDTLFNLNKDYQLIPKYVFKADNLKIPVSDRLKFPIGDILWSHKTLFEVYQTKNYLFLKFLFGHNFPAKRITPKPSPFPGQNEIWINTNYILGVFNKESGDLTLCKPTSTDNPLFTSGIYNDIDCGPRFFPETMVNDSTLLMSINSNELKKHVASDDFKNGSSKFPDKKKKLENFAESLNVLDNPVLMLVTFK
jgi:hypothetical protein